MYEARIAMCAVCLTRQIRSSTGCATAARSLWGLNEAGGRTHVLREHTPGFPAISHGTGWPTRNTVLRGIAFHLESEAGGLSKQTARRKPYRPSVALRAESSRDTCRELAPYGDVALVAEIRACCREESRTASAGGSRVAAGEIARIVTRCGEDDGGDKHARSKIRAVCSRRVPRDSTTTVAAT